MDLLTGLFLFCLVQVVGSTWFLMIPGNHIQTKRPLLTTSPNYPFQTPAQQYDVSCVIEPTTYAVITVNYRSLFFESGLPCSEQLYIRENGRTRPDSRVCNREDRITVVEPVQSNFTFNSTCSLLEIVYQKSSPTTGGKFLIQVRGLWNGHSSEIRMSCRTSNNQLLRISLPRCHLLAPSPTRTSTTRPTELSPATESTTNNSSDMLPGLLGGLAGLFVVVIVIVGLIYFLWRRRNATQKEDVPASPRTPGTRMNTNENDIRISLPNSLYETLDAVDSNVTTDGTKFRQTVKNYDNHTAIHKKPENAHKNDGFQQSIEELYAKVDKSAKSKPRAIGGKTMGDETVMYDNNGLYLKTVTNLSSPYETVMQENDLYVS